MPEEAPPGILPLFLRGSTAEKYGFKTGEGVMDLVDHLLLPKVEVEKEIETLGVMSDFNAAKKEITNAPGDDLLFVVDKESKYGEVFLLCFTEESKQNFLNIALEKQAALEAQLKAEEDAKLAAEAAAYARANVVYEDKPLEPRPWESETSEATMEEIDLRSVKSFRDPICLEIYRPKRNLKMPYRFLDRNSDVAGSLQEFRAMKDPNFMGIKENDIGFQIAVATTTSSSQTTYNKSTNKACQYESLQKETGTSPESSNRVELCLFLEKAAELLEAALQQNETIDIFNDTFKTTADDEGEGNGDENELREIKNFADPNYSKAKRLSAIDWMPKMQGMVATSAVRNISFDERSALSGQVYTSHILLWDFRQLVRPYLLMQSAHEIYSFQFNRQNPGLVVGGSITGQVVLWDISDYVSVSKRQKSADGDDDDVTISPILPKLISSIDQSHKRPVADIFWLPPNTQINHRGRLVPDEYLDDNSYQFITVSGDATIMVWDIRYMEIANDELRHIGRAKNVPVEKSKDGTIKFLWAPIFKAQLKRMDGVGELSLCKVACTGCLRPKLAQNSNTPGDYRSHILIADEEGDLLSVDMCALPKESESGAAGKGKGDDEDDGGHAEVARDFIKWMVKDHSRPAVSLRQSPFLPDIVLSVSDWNFHIWKVGQDRPIFVSPKSKAYLSCGVWSPTRPSVVFLACADGTVLAWDFTDSSYKASIELKATHTNISSIEFLTSTTSTTAATAKNQLLALGTDQGVLHVFEVPPSLSRAVNKEESLMQNFADREMDRISSIEYGDEDELLAEHAGGQFTGAGIDAPAEGEVKIDEPKNEELEALNKEEDAFMKMEHEFLLELGLITEEEGGEEKK